MRLARLALGGLLAFAGAASAASADYYAIGGGDGYMIMIDKTSINQTGGYSRGWVVTLKASPGGADDAPITSMLIEMDCQQDRTRLIGFKAQDADGSVVGSDEDVGEWSDVASGTAGEDVRNAICSPEGVTEHHLPSDSPVAIRNAFIQSLKE
jgi:hypothetical protein